jgi:hypothetical protein
LGLCSYQGFGEAYNGQKQVLGTDDTCPQGSLSLLEDKVEVAGSVLERAKKLRHFYQGLWHCNYLRQSRVQESMILKSISAYFFFSLQVLERCADQVIGKSKQERVRSSTWRKKQF